MLDKESLRRLRNELPMASLVAALGRDAPPSKIRNGRFVFLCPHCGEMETFVNPRNNLAHCFSSDKNLNTIDLLMLLGYDFAATVSLLEGLLTRHHSQGPNGGTDRSTTPEVE
jgi:DNA primase